MFFLPCHSKDRPKLLARSSGVLIVVLLLMATFYGATSQSGRRLPKSAPTPAPEPSPEIEPVKKPDRSKEPSLKLIVGIDDHSMYAMPIYYNSAVLEACINRLRDSEAVRIDGTERNMNRGSAVNKAKAEKEIFVVYLELGVDSLARRSPAGIVEVDDLYVGFTVFSPTTAKIAASGRTYPQAHRRVGIGVPSRGPLFGEYLLKEAAREAAERIMAAFHIKPLRD